MEHILTSIYKLNDYSQRIDNVNSRISKLDNRLSSLYGIEGLVDLWRLIQTNALTEPCGILRKCRSYLQQTATDFQTLEDNLISLDPIGLNPFIVAISQLSFNPDSSDNSLSSVILPEFGTTNDPISQYKDIINGEGSTIEKKDAVIKWLNSLRKDATTLKDYYEWFADKGEIDWPTPIKNGFDFIKAIDTCNKIVNYSFAVATNDLEKMSENGKGVISAAFGAFEKENALKSFFDTPGKTTGYLNGLLLSYGKHMTQNFIDSIQENDEIAEVYWDVFATSAVDVFYDEICNTPTLALAYVPTKILTSAVGYDIQGAYEEVSDKKGFAAVTDGVGQLYNEIKENSSWENWCSGMAIIGDGIKKGWDSFWDRIF